MSTLPAPYPPPANFCSCRPPHAQGPAYTIPILSLLAVWSISHALPLAPRQSRALLPGFPSSILAFLMLMEVSIPGRKLKPLSSIKAGSPCPCTVTLAPVTVDSSGMKSFCSVRRVRDRPGTCRGAEWEECLGKALGDGNPPSHPAQFLMFQVEQSRKTYKWMWQPLSWIMGADWKDWDSIPITSGVDNVVPIVEKEQ